MKKLSTHFFAAIALLVLVGFAFSQQANAQIVQVAPTPLYRFEVSYWDGGHLLTGVYLEGPANGYSYDPIPFPSNDGLGIYVPPPGYEPLPGFFPGAPLVPLYRWTVIEDGWRTHYYYSIYYTDQPSNRYFNGIAGWVFQPNVTQATLGGFGPGQVPLYPLSVWYSSDLGFWNGYGGVPESADPPPNREGRSPYGFQGWICRLPPMSEAGILAVPFAPPGGGGGGGGGNNGDCNPPQSTLNACQHNGGWWNYEGCYCEY
jgi:hypothetical protein